MPLFNNLTFFSIILLSISMIFVLLIFSYRARMFLPRYRIAKVMKSGSRNGIQPKDIPSIARRHYSFIKHKQSASSERSIFALIAWFDQMLETIGVTISLPLFGCSLVIFMAIFSFALHYTLGLSLSVATIIVVPTVVFVVFRILLGRRSAQLRRFQSIFPEALDLIVRSVRAGLPVSESIKMIGTEVADPVGYSFRQVDANLKIGLSLEQSLTILQRTIPLPEVKFFVISLTIQQETGGNLAEILSNLASIMRKRVQIGKKIQALSSEARASALIIGSLPFVVGSAIFFMNRDYIEVLFLTETGQIFTFGALASMTLGAIVMAKLIRFEI